MNIVAILATTIIYYLCCYISHGQTGAKQVLINELMIQTLRQRLEKYGCYDVDVNHLVDRSLTYQENLKNIANQLGLAHVLEQEAMEETIDCEVKARLIEAKPRRIRRSKPRAIESSKIQNTLPESLKHIEIPTAQPIREPTMSTWHTTTIAYHVGQLPQQQAFRESAIKRDMENKSGSGFMSFLSDLAWQLNHLP